MSAGVEILLLVVRVCIRIIDWSYCRVIPKDEQLALVVGCWLLAATPQRAHTPTPRASSVNPLGLAETAKGGRTGAQRRSFFRLANKTEGRQNNDFSVSLAAASCCSSGADPWS